MQKLKRMAQGFGVLACFLFISVGAHAQATNDDILDAVQELDAFVEEVQDEIEDLIAEENAAVLARVQLVDDFLEEVDDGLTERIETIDNFLEEVEDEILERVQLVDDFLEEVDDGLTAKLDEICDKIEELDAFVEEVQDQIEDLIEEEFAGLNSANIEKCLQKNVKIASVYLPEANGGQQTLVFMIVQNTINNVLASGESVGAAQSLLNGAINLAGMGQHKQAWNYASNAYQAATN